MKKQCKRYLSMITNQTGSSLVLALIVTFMLITLVTIVVHFSNTELKSAQKQERQTSAYYIAEAGLERAIYEVNQSLKKGEEPASLFDDSNFKGGSYKATVTPKKNEHNENIGYTVESIGSYENEEKKVTRWVRQPIWPPGPTPTPLSFAMYANEQLEVQTLSGLLGIGLLEAHPIKVTGNIHGNDYVRLEHNGILTHDPYVNGVVSSTSVSNIFISGLSADKKKVYAPIPQPQFDFDYAREQAKKSGGYILEQNATLISILGLAAKSKVIFIDGNLALSGLDLLGIALQDRTIIVTGTISGFLELGGNELVNTKLNLIAKENINFLGAVTGLQVNGVLYAQGNITTEGHLEVDGYIGANNIDCGAGILSNLLGLLTGEMSFTYDPSVFTSLPSGIGFKKMYVEVVE